LKPKVQPWGSYLRYKYATLDFSSIDRPGLYYIQYGTQRTETFPIGPQVYDGIWHLTHDVFFPVQMDHMRVNEAYRVWHGVPHMDDALQAPVNIQHFDGYRMGATTETRFKPGERIPGLAVGGWFDAGDFDIQTLSHAAAIMHLVDTWESFKPTRDETLIDQASRYVDIHRPDGKTDILQQVEHGALQVAAQHRVFGRGIRGIVDPHIHQYTHLGDASTQTDGLLYDPSLGLFDVDGNRSGLPDDRWAFTARTPVTNYGSIGSLAAAARALSGYNTTFANECLALARKAYAEERQNATPAPNAGFEGAFRDGAEMSAVLQLLKTTKDTEYAARFQELVWPALDRRLDFNLLPAVRALPLLDDAYKNRLRPYIVKYKDSLDALEKQNPYGVPIGTGGWAGNGGVIGWSTTNYFVHKAFPDLIGPEYTLRGLEYILGRHPASNISFVSGVGARSKKVAYGSNRADFSFIAGGVVPGVLILRPDFPENKEDWPFLWGENEYVIGIAGHYIFLAHAAAELVAGAQQAASTAVPTEADNTREATEQDHRNMMEQLGISALRPGPSGNEQAPNRANYDEALANRFPNLPDPLTTKAGHKVTTAEAWWKERRPEIVEDFEREVYGRVPSNVPPVTWTVVKTVEENVGGRPVVGRRVVGHVENSAYPAINVDIDLVVVTPREANKPVPLMMMFRGGVLPGEPPPQLPFKLPPGWEGSDPPATEQLIAAGWGYAFLNPGSVQADNGAGLTKGIIGLVNKGQPRKPDDWGALRAWAWGASRALDHLETDRTVDATRVGIEGVSRFGKAALVTMAFDTRFAVGLIASSGEGGTKLHRRNFGEMVENLTGSGGYHWMAGNFLRYGAADASFRSKNAGDLPVDSHELIALCAPRPVFISHGIPEQGDARWLDHQGSFMAAVAAGPVYRLLGAKDLGTSDDYMKERMPPVNVGLLEGDLAWRQHDAGHSDGPNWRFFIPWAVQKMGSG
jgi:hypothetical protein